MGLRAKTKGQDRVTIRANGVTYKGKDTSIDYPHDSPESRVSVAVGIRRSENYQSVSLDVRVEVPCHPGKEMEAGEFCVDRCSELLKANEGDLEGLLRTLQ